jgi:hypothetical protein
MVLLLIIHFSRMYLRHARKLRRIKQKREEVLKSRSTLRKDFNSRHRQQRDERPRRSRRPD